MAKLTLTYIFHSCFMLETERFIAVFDYWKDSPDKLVEHTAAATHKRMYFLSSHFHIDHFNPDIIKMAVPYGDKKVILSQDIIRHKRARKADADIVLRKGDTYSDDMMSLKAYGSTDVGLSFMMQTEGLHIFHAGDLNNWHWEDESTPAEVKKMNGDFMAILRDIKADCPAVDLAMFPVDPRLKTDFYRGARRWIETIRTHYFAPMHFPPATKTAMTFGAIAQQMGVDFLYIHHPGEVILQTGE